MSKQVLILIFFSLLLMKLNFYLWYISVGNFQCMFPSATQKKTVWIYGQLSIYTQFCCWTDRIFHNSASNVFEFLFSTSKIKKKIFRKPTFFSYIFWRPFSSRYMQKIIFWARISKFILFVLKDINILFISAEIWREKFFE